jgi:aspartyl-tRNA synthetase
MSFVSREDVFSLTEGMLVHVFGKTLRKELSVPFTRLSYRDAMERYGTDKPDLRFGLEMQDFTAFVPEGEFQVFKKVLEEGGSVKALVVPGGGSTSRKQINELEEQAKVFGARGLAWMKVTDSGLDGGISRFYEQSGSRIAETLKAKPGDLILLVGSDWRTACTALGAVRSHLGESRKLADPGEFRFCWIVDFPLFEWNEEEEKWDPAHHMFSMPQEAYIASLEENPGDVKGDLYDLVCNGVELASGSIRIHDPDLQRRIFKIVGFTEEEAARRFGFLLRAFRYGPPPHGGIAPGLDRIVMLMAGETTIRDVIAFPKNTVGVSPMDECPSEVDPGQLAELGLKFEPDSSAERGKGTQS